MELKHYGSAPSLFDEVLLIVPYGIETYNQGYYDRSQCLLIVPYGIETKFLELNMRQGYLLIVPYGIETLYYSPYTHFSAPFNRTLWN